MPGYDYLDLIPRERTYLLPALHAVHEHEGHLGAEGLLAVSRHMRVPGSELYGIARSYSEFRFEAPTATTVSICTGLSCRLGGADSLLEQARTQFAASDCEVEARPCRFRCDQAPVASVGEDPIPQANLAAVGMAIEAARAGRHLEAPRLLREAQPLEMRRVLTRCARVDPSSLASAISFGAYEGLRAARALAPEQAAEQVLTSGLLGRGGAYFPTGRKWQTARAFARPRYLVVNAEEGEPGVFKDRVLLEHDPHLLVEGLLIAAHALEVERAFVYVNGEARLAAARVEHALAEAKAAGQLGALVIEVRRGAGGYVCGEESVILSSIEGERAVPRLRPPLPVERGLWGRPTVINNVETLANLPSIFREGVEAFRVVGTGAQPGTKILSLSGDIARPGVYEVPLGTPLRAVIEELGGGPLPERTLAAALCGGPSGGLLPERLWDVPLLGGPLDASGAALGAGGIVVLDDSMPVSEVVAHLAAYNAAESCGKCTPCREGTPRMRDLLRALASGSAPADAITLLDDLDEAMSTASLCGLGQMAALPFRSARTHFLEELTGGSR